jgi:hypothetical protein
LLCTDLLATHTFVQRRPTLHWYPLRNIGRYNIEFYNIEVYNIEFYTIDITHHLGLDVQARATPSEMSQSPLARRSDSTSVYTLPLNERKQSCTPGLLTTTGMLYEGTFAEWLPVTGSRCHLQTPRKLCEAGENLNCDDDDETCSCKQYDLNLKRKWISEMHHKISPYLLDRVPDSAWQSENALFTALNKVSSPFRIMDLPPELRDLVWNEVRPSWRAELSGVKFIVSPSNCPELLQVSRAVTREVSALMAFDIKFHGYRESMRQSSFIVLQ